MKTVHVSKIESNWQLADNALFQADIAPSTHSRLRLKLLVFENNRELCRFWSRLRPSRGKLGGLCKRTRGAVNGLSREVRCFEKGKPDRAYIERDARYFAVMGLIKGYLGMEIITHECGHAAIAYVNRTRGRLDWDGGLPEEEWCYPLGRIARGVVNALDKGGFYEPSQTFTPPKWRPKSQ